MTRISVGFWIISHFSGVKQLKKIKRLPFCLDIHRWRIAVPLNSSSALENRWWREQILKGISAKSWGLGRDGCSQGCHAPSRIPCPPPKRHPRGQNPGGCHIGGGSVLAKGPAYAQPGGVSHSSTKNKPQLRHCLFPLIEKKPYIKSANWLGSSGMCWEGTQDVSKALQVEALAQDPSSNWLFAPLFLGKIQHLLRSQKKSSFGELEPGGQTKIFPKIKNGMETPSGQKMHCWGPSNHQRKYVGLAAQMVFGRPRG